MKRRKILRKVLDGSRNLRFADMLHLAEGFGFRLVRIRGSHHILEHPDIPEQLNLQSREGEAKPYQIQQFLALVERHRLTMQDEREDAE